MSEIKPWSAHARHVPYPLSYLSSLFISLVVVLAGHKWIVGLAHRWLHCSWESQMAEMPGVNWELIVVAPGIELSASNEAGAVAMAMILPTPLTTFEDLFPP